MPINGQTVGMAVKMAGDILMRSVFPIEYFQSRAFSQDLHEMASDIIRVSARLQDGHLAASVARREKDKAPAARPDIEPDYSQLPPPNSRESGQTDTAAGRYGPQGEQAQYQPERPAAFPSGGSLPMDDDEIPF